MREGEAFSILVELLGHKGRLKIITSEIDKNHPVGMTAFNPAYFVQHDVVRIEKDKEGILKAWSEEGDWCRGEPSALLSRLTEHNVLGIPNTRG